MMLLCTSLITLLSEKQLRAQYETENEYNFDRNFKLPLRHIAVLISIDHTRLLYTMKFRTATSLTDSRSVYTVVKVRGDNRAG